MTTQSFASSALVGMSLSLHLLDKLLKKGVLSADEVCGIAECSFRRSRSVIPRSCRSLFRHDVARLRGPAGECFLAKGVALVNP